MAKQLSLSAAILRLQTPGSSQEAKATRSKGLKAYRKACHFPPKTNLQEVLKHLKNVYGVVPGRQYLKARTFRNIHDGKRGLKLVRSDGQILHLGRWWSSVGLRQFGIQECAEDVVRLGAIQSPRFIPGVESDKPFQDKFRVARKNKK